MTRLARRQRTKWIKYWKKRGAVYRKRSMWLRSCFHVTIPIED